MKADFVLILVAVSLGACRPAQQAPALPEDTERGDRTELPDADVNASLSELGAAPDFPAEATPKFIGSWASRKSVCASHPLRFTADSLETPSGSLCRFEQVRQVADGYDVEARCTADGSEQSGLIRMRFEGPDRMRLESDLVADVDLTSCRRPARSSR